MQRRTLILFAAMLVLFAFYVAMSLQAMPDIQGELKAQTELLNGLDRGPQTKTAHN